MKLIRSIEALTRVAGWLGAILVFPLIGALIVEVFSRYVAGRPTLWAFEVSYMVMGAMFIMLVENGLAKLGLTSYVHTIVISALLIFAVIANNYRQKLILTVRV